MNNILIIHDDTTMTEAATLTIDDYVPDLLLIRLNPELLNPLKKSLTTLMEMPPRRIRTRVERGEYARIDEAAYDKHRTVDTSAHRVGLITKGCPEPLLGICDDSRSTFFLGHTPVSAGGMYGNPRKCWRFENLLRQVG
jgi:hypothetical protein